jgi:hypothetical protein
LEHLKRLNANPDFKAKRLEYLKNYHSSKEHKEQLKRLHAQISHKVEIIDTLNNETTVYLSIREAARAIGVAQCSITNAFKRKGCEASTIFIKKKRYRITKLSN